MSKKTDKSVKNIITAKAAITTFIILSGLTLVYHFLILTQVVPYANAWGGQLKSLSDMYAFEAVSVVMQLVIVSLAYARYRDVVSGKKRQLFKVVMYVLVGLFALNTLDNLASTSTFETIVFTPMTLVLAVVSWRLAVD